MYIYESHLGGFYTSDEYLDYEDLYCEECGDSDGLFGEYDENDAIRFWNDTKEDYTPNYIMQFIEETFNIKGYNVYLLCKDKKTGKIYVNFESKNHKFGECHALPSSVCITADAEESLVYTLMSWNARILTGPIVYRHGEDVLYEYLVEDDRAEKDTTFYEKNSWYGYVTADNYKPVERQEWIGEHIEK